MPLHIPAMAAAAMGWMSAQDCEEGGGTDSVGPGQDEIVGSNHDDDDNGHHDTQAPSLSPGPLSPMSISQKSLGRSLNQQQASVRFSGAAGTGSNSSILNPLSVRSMFSERLNGDFDRHNSVRLRSVASLQDSEDFDEMSMFDSFNGFVGGDFASGKVKDIRLPTGCWVMSFSERSNALAVGLKDQIDFLETNTYTCMYSLPRNDKVSAIEWCRGSALFVGEHHPQQQTNISKHADGDSNLLNNKQDFQNGQNGIHDHDHHRQHNKDGELCAVAGLDGQVSVYHLNISLLEIEGVKVLHEFQVNGQVRSMAMESFAHGVLVLAVGDKQGSITLSTMAQQEEGDRVVELHRTTLNLGNDPILGLAVNSQRSILVATTKSGLVVVHRLVPPSNNNRLKRIHNNISPKRHPFEFGPKVWSTQRNGAVRSAEMSTDGKQLAFGGYDKTVVLVDTDLWAITRELSLQGTVNALALDYLDRFMAVGCRDKSLTFYDTSTFFPIKRLETSGWVTSISWGVSGLFSDVVAVRSENKGISLLDLTPIHRTDVNLPSSDGTGMVSSISWSPEGHYLARLERDHIHVTDARFGFCQVASIKLGGCSLRNVAFGPSTCENNGDNSPRLKTVADMDFAVESKDQKAALGIDSPESGTRLAAVGLDGYLHLMELHPKEGRLALLQSIYVEPDLWVVKWSLGGKGKKLHIFSTDTMEEIHSLEEDGRIWDIGFIKTPSNPDMTDQQCAMAIASGDYKTIFYDRNSMQPTLQVLRSRTVRCLSYHPTLPLLAMGDGAGMTAIVDYVEEETTIEIDVGGRVNVLEFSPKGDFLLIGTDDCCFTLHETKSFKPVQELKRSGFALSAAFSPTGKYLALGSANESYSVVRLGPLLGIDLVPLKVKYGVSQLPSWALKETLYRSGCGPSLLQRHMMNGSADSLQWVAAILKEHPDAVYCYDRYRKEGCFDTALRLRKIKLLKLAVTTLVDGTLESKNERRSILTTDVPEIGRATLESMIENHPPEFVVEILKVMRFVKVPFTEPHVVSKEKMMTCASPLYLDPWVHTTLVGSSSKAAVLGKLTKTPAVLPLPGLGKMKFLSALVSNAPATVFDNEAMGIVLRVMWQYHIRKYFMIDTAIFLFYYFLWIVLVDSTSTTTSSSLFVVSLADRITAAVVVVLNTVYAVKELVQADLGRRPEYFLSVWNSVDCISIILVYFYAISTGFRVEKSDNLVPLAVVTSLLLTMKLLSYLRAFSDTGWLITVLSRNVLDVRGFLVVLLAILVGFSVSFRLLFANNEPECSLELDEATESLVSDCDQNPFSSLRRSFLATFELTILGSYDPAILYESRYSVLAILTFIFAITSVLVVALNALISVLADSYARVQENASANRRKEKAEIIVEYMSLLPPWRRRRIEKNTKYFHALLEADEEGDLVLDNEDWRGGLNALRDDMEEICQHHADANRKALEEIKSDLDRELSSLRTEVTDMLRELSDDVKRVKGETAGVKLTGRHVAGAVRAVKQISRRGSNLLKPNENK